MPRGQYDRTKSKAKKKREENREPETLKLTELELARLEQYGAKIRACDSERLVVLSQKNAYIQQIDPIGHLGKYDSKMSALRQERDEADSGYQAISAAVEKRLGIKLKEYAYDDTTGQLNHVQPQTEIKK
jgi:hypothetical protein